MSNNMAHLVNIPIRVELQSYKPLLDQEKITYMENNYWLMVSDIPSDRLWTLHISIRVKQAPSMLRKVLPILKRHAVAFRLIRDQLFNFQVNAGFFGEQTLGRAISIFPSSEAEAVLLSEELCAATAAFNGISIPGCIRLGEVVYADFFEQVITEKNNKPVTTVRLFIPKHIPFDRDRIRKYRRTFLQQRIIGRYYFPLKLLRRSTIKGNIYRAGYFSGYSWHSCVIKQGRANAIDDHMDRDIKNRLLWQQRVMNDLYSTGHLPAIHRFFTDREDVYLVMEHIKGPNMQEKINSIYRGRCWHKLAVHTRKQILLYYLQVLDIVQAIHEKGYVHRDLSDTNLILSRHQKIYLVDFELAYSLKQQLPDPPYVLGTLEYMAPEQLQYSIPTIYEDIYSLGALFLFFVSGQQPVSVTGNDLTLLSSRLAAITGNIHIAAVIQRALCPQGTARPEIHEIRDEIMAFMEVVS